MSDSQNRHPMQRIETLLKALLHEQLHWIGGYAHGRTSNGDPFLILYPAADYLNHKVCRVYDHDLRKLPDFVDTDVAADCDTNDNPTKDKALKLGIYRPVERYFQVVTVPGRETQMGNEVRFFDVVAIASKGPAGAAERPAQQPARREAQQQTTVRAGRAPQPRAQQPAQAKPAGNGQAQSTPLYGNGQPVDTANWKEFNAYKDYLEAHKGALPADRDSLRNWFTKKVAA